MCFVGANFDCFLTLLPYLISRSSIYDSHSLNLAEHKPFISGKSEHTPEIKLVEKLPQRANISDTDRGADILEKINDLRELLKAYRSGTIKERFTE